MIYALTFNLILSSGRLAIFIPATVNPPILKVFPFLNIILNSLKFRLFTSTLNESLVSSTIFPVKPSNCLLFELTISTCSPMNSSRILFIILPFCFFAKTALNFIQILIRITLTSQVNCFCGEADFHQCLLNFY